MVRRSASPWALAGSRFRSSSSPPVAPPRRPSKETAGVPPEKVNYRSIGRGTGGVQLHKAGPTLAERQAMREEMYGATPATIPSSFETVLYRGNAEHQGFGARAPRFGQPRRSDDNGPGAHDPGKPQEQPCIGARGHGSFASRNPRLPLALGRNLPGPGQYEEQNQPGSARASAAFVLPASSNPAKFYQRPQPGPGDYSPKAPSSPTVAAAMAKTGRDTPAVGSGALSARKADSGPGPGDYQGDPEPLAAGGASRSDSHGPSLGPARRLVPPPPNIEALPENAQLRAAEDVLALAPGVPVGNALMGPPRPKKAQPMGPGDYDVPRAYEAVHGHQHFATGLGVSFQAGKSHLPRSWRPVKPGPTDYDPPENPMHTRPDSTANVAFTSRQDGAGYRKSPAPHAPGPAWYTPRKPDKSQSFHLNLGNRWLS